MDTLRLVSEVNDLKKQRRDLTRTVDELKKEKIALIGHLKIEKKIKGDCMDGLRHMIFKRDEVIKLAESDLYHICKFNVNVKSMHLIKIKKFMRENEIEESD